MTSLGLKVTPANLALLSLFVSSACPVMARLLFIIFRTVFGTLYPAYASYKAVKTKNVREYVKWMMYWIVFAFLTCIEDITDVVLVFWLPFYYELKIILMIWLLSPTANGSSILYRKFVHPQLMMRENQIDEYIERARADGYNTMADLIATGGRLVTRAVQEAAIPFVNRFVQEAAVGGRFNMTRSYSTNDINVHDGPTREYYRPITNVDEGVEIMDLDSDTDDFSLGSTARQLKFPKSKKTGARKDDLSSGYSGSEAINCAQPEPSTSNRNAEVTGSKSGRKSPGRAKTKAVNFEQPGSSQYATLPRTTKRSTKKKATNDK